MYERGTLLAPTPAPVPAVTKHHSCSCGSSSSFCARTGSDSLGSNTRIGPVTNPTPGCRTTRQKVNIQVIALGSRQVIVIASTQHEVKPKARREIASEVSSPLLTNGLHLRAHFASTHTRAVPSLGGASTFHSDDHVAEYADLESTHVVTITKSNILDQVTASP